MGESVDDRAEACELAGLDRETWAARLVGEDSAALRADAMKVSQLLRVRPTIDDLTPAQLRGMSLAEIAAMVPKGDVAPDPFAGKSPADIRSAVVPLGWPKLPGVK